MPVEALADHGARCVGPNRHRGGVSGPRPGLAASLRNVLDSDRPLAVTDSRRVRAILSTNARLTLARAIELATIVASVVGAVALLSVLCG